MMEHRVKKYKWTEGNLSSREYYFKDLKEAVEFANSSEEQTVKVFNDQGDLVHHVEDKKVVMDANE